MTATPLGVREPVRLAGPWGNVRALDLDFRFGWQHDYASTARPITANADATRSALIDPYRYIVWLCSRRVDRD
jgi:hypothetical protein